MAAALLTSATERMILLTLTPSSPGFFDFDLITEASDALRGERNTEIPGVTETVSRQGAVTLRKIRIRTEEGARLLQRPAGSYITLEMPPLSRFDPDLERDAVLAIANALPPLIAEKTDFSPTDGILLLGLGNRSAAADALGPATVERCPVTRHYARFAPEALPPDTRPLSALIPGVLGTTGLETRDILAGIVEKTHPAAIVAVDALSAQNVERIGCTLQLTNTGIRPGSGLKTGRAALNEETLGTPVIAIGCPTIVSAAVIARRLLEHPLAGPTAAAHAGAITRDVFSFFNHDLAVTPKEIDTLTQNAARIIARGLTRALLPGLPLREAAAFVP